jgi:protein translocase SecG subunit
MVTILKIAQMILSVLLALIILVQHKQASLSITNFGGEATKYERRGPEKTLHMATIILGVLFILNAIAYFIVG